MPAKSRVVQIAVSSTNVLYLLDDAGHVWQKGGLEGAFERITLPPQLERTAPGETRSRPHRG